MCFIRGTCYIKLILRIRDLNKFQMLSVTFGCVSCLWHTLCMSDASNLSKKSVFSTQTSSSIYCSPSYLFNVPINILKDVLFNLKVQTPLLKNKEISRILKICKKINKNKVHFYEIKTPVIAG